jgi:hypothetical protein
VAHEPVGVMTGGNALRGDGPHLPNEGNTEVGQRGSMRDKLRVLSRDFSTPEEPPRPGRAWETLESSDYTLDRELEAGDDYQPGAGFDIDEFRVATSLEGHAILPARPWRSRGVGVNWVLGTIVLAAITAAATALVVPRSCRRHPRKILRWHQQILQAPPLNLKRPSLAAP